MTFTAFLFIYNGFGVSDTSTPAWLLWALFVFCISLLLSVHFFRAAFRRIGVTISKGDKVYGRVFSDGAIPFYILATYYFVVLSSLITPEFKLYRLITPPRPNIFLWFEETLSGEGSGGIRYYLEILITPIFYLALQRLRRQPLLLFLVLFFPLYIEYVGSAYIGRYQVGFAALFFIAYLWGRYPNARVYFLALGAALLPIILIALYVYSKVRLGLTVGETLMSFDNGIVGAITQTLESETNFLQRSGNAIVLSGDRVDIFAYFTWLFTMPLPGFMKVGLQLSYINYEISESVLGLPRGAQGFYVVLPGLLAESIYVYGNFFFWLHAINIGMLIALSEQLFGKSKNLIFMRNFFIISFGIVLNRGGIAAFAPSMFNALILLFAILFTITVHRQSS
jgi:hypothetical protein